MLDLLDDYVDHIRKTKNKSLLARIYGIFTVKTDYFDPLDIIVMQNTSVLRNSKSEKLIFDLKGSTVGRKTNFSPSDEKFWLKTLNYKKVLKDLNYLEMNQDLDGCLMNLTGNQYDQLEWLLKLDSIFLKNHDLMDYSVLLVIENLPVDLDYIDSIKTKTMFDYVSQKSYNPKDNP